MIFNKHSNLEGKHAFLSPSSYHWINYDAQKLIARWHTVRSSVKGTELHDLASHAIKLGVKLSPTDKPIGPYVNDAIKYGMTSEQMLFYSVNCFGTADAISFRKKKLRIHDLKTGMTKASIHQLEVYAALFCLEYEISPFEIEIEMRIYQGDEIQTYIGDPDFITHIMDKIITFDHKIEMLKEEAFN